MKMLRFGIAILSILILQLSTACISTSGTGLVISSPEFGDGEVIPIDFTCNGKNMSPEIDWSGAPQATKSFALTMQDPDAPGGTFTHWMVYDMPTSMILLPKRMADVALISGGIKQGTNDFGDIGYSGPCPPAGETHHYVFTIYALDAMLDIAPAADISRLLEVMQPRILEKASMTVTSSTLK